MTKHKMGELAALKLLAGAGDDEPRRAARGMKRVRQVQNKGRRWEAQEGGTGRDVWAGLVGSER